MQETGIKLIDTHCHPQFPQYDNDRDAVIRRALENQVGMICVGTNLENSKAAIKLAEKYERMYAAVGLHPNESEEKYDAHVYRDLLKEQKVVAIGETGLDYYRTKEASLQDSQRARLLSHLEIAVAAGLPVILHCREAHSDMRGILSKSEFSSVTGVIHSFTGTWEDAKHYIEMGYSIGMNGIITFTHDYDETIMNVPLASVLLETDSPYLTPNPHRGRRNEPAYVMEVAKKLAEVRNVELEEIEKITTDNAFTLFSRLMRVN